MRIFKRRIAEARLPFTRDAYDNAIGLFQRFASDPDEFGVDPAEDAACARVVEAFLADGLLTLDELLADQRPGSVEAQKGHEVVKVLARASIKAGAANPALPVTWLVDRVADRVAQEARFALQDPRYAVHRAERVVLEAACATFLSLVELETLVPDPVKGAEEAAQCVGLILMMWLVWNRPYEFAAFKGEDLLP